MKVGITHFSVKGFDWFQKLSRKKQKEYLIKQGNHEKTINNILKGVKYAKFLKVKKPSTED